jgi:hypothetical protein
MTPYPKRLIEVDLPIKRISAHARREKSIRHGHISTLLLSPFPIRYPPFAIYREITHNSREPLDGNPDHFKLGIHTPGAFGEKGISLTVPEIYCMICYTICHAMSSVRSFRARRNRWQDTL